MTDDTLIEGPLYEKRKKVYPQSVHGRLRRIKWTILCVTLGVYYLLPFVRWNRGPGPVAEVHADDPPASRGAAREALERARLFPARRAPARPERHERAPPAAAGEQARERHVRAGKVCGGERRRDAARRAVAREPEDRERGDRRRREDQPRQPPRRREASGHEHAIVSTSERPSDAPDWASVGKNRCKPPGEMHVAKKHGSLQRVRAESRTPRVLERGNHKRSQGRRGESSHPVT